jgi:hypothetical protein
MRKMIRSSETSVLTTATWRNAAEDGILHTAVEISNPTNKHLLMDVEISSENPIQAAN